MQCHASMLRGLAAHPRVHCGHKTWQACHNRSLTPCRRSLFSCGAAALDESLAAEQQPASAAAATAPAPLSEALAAAAPTPALEAAAPAAASDVAPTAPTAPIISDTRISHSSNPGKVAGFIMGRLIDAPPGSTCTLSATNSEARHKAVTALAIASVMLAQRNCGGEVRFTVRRVHAQPPDPDQQPAQQGQQEQEAGQGDAAAAANGRNWMSTTFMAWYVPQQVLSSEPADQGGSSQDAPSEAQDLRVAKDTPGDKLGNALVKSLQKQPEAVLRAVGPLSVNKALESFEYARRALRDADEGWSFHVVANQEVEGGDSEPGPSAEGSMGAKVVALRVVRKGGRRPGRTSSRKVAAVAGEAVQAPPGMVLVPEEEWARVQQQVADMTQQVAALVAALQTEQATQGQQQ